MSNEGWISIHRKMLTNPIFQAKPFCKGFAWVTLLLLTNRKVGYKTIKNGTKIKIKRGECGYSLKALSDIFGWSRGKVKRWLDSLENDNMTDTKKIGQDSYIIRILNYDIYQNGQQTDTQTDTKTVTQKTLKTVTKKAGSNADNIDISKSELEKMIQQKIKETYIPSVQKMDTNNNIDIKSIDIYKSSSSSSKNFEEFYKNLSEEEEEILKNYSKGEKIRYFRPWLRKIFENGDFEEVLSKAIAKDKKEKQKAQRYELKAEVPPEKNEDKALVDAAMKKARAQVIKGLQTKQEQNK